MASHAFHGSTNRLAPRASVVGNKCGDEIGLVLVWTMAVFWCICRPLLVLHVYPVCGQGAYMCVLQRVELAHVVPQLLVQRIQVEDKLL